MNLRSYIFVTGAYWGFTLTDGALRMLVLLHFADLGYRPVQLAFLFLFYEFFGIVTNLVGGWIGSRLGLRVTLLGGLVLQVIALGLLAQLNPSWPREWSVTYVMLMQSLSGIAKDLTKMSSKSAIKVLVPEDAKGTLFKWVAILTGSKNALKGVGFFLGGFLLHAAGYAGALRWMAGGLLVILGRLLVRTAGGHGSGQKENRLRGNLFKNEGDQYPLGQLRFFLFGARDTFGSWSASRFFSKARSSGAFPKWALSWPFG